MRHKRKGKKIKERFAIMQNVLFQSKVKVELKKKVRSVEEGIEN